MYKHINFTRVVSPYKATPNSPSFFIGLDTRCTMIVKYYFIVSQRPLFSLLKGGLKRRGGTSFFLRF